MKAEYIISWLGFLGLILAYITSFIAIVGLIKYCPTLGWCLLGVWIFALSKLLLKIIE